MLVSNICLETSFQEQTEEVVSKSPKRSATRFILVVLMRSQPQQKINSTYRKIPCNMIKMDSAFSKKSNFAVFQALAGARAKVIFLFLFSLFNLHCLFPLCNMSHLFYYGPAFASRMSNYGGTNIHY